MSLRGDYTSSMSNDQMKCEECNEPALGNNKLCLEHIKPVRQLDDIRALRDDWPKAQDYLAPRLPPHYYGPIEWLATTPINEVIETLKKLEATQLAAQGASS